ncbi:hypothetical protein [Nostoc sp. NMS8]|uniref:hypothetical protein n=1 Tax=Nostoc sp. NMS8 TaxID=2815392 RepID=UPI0025D9789B|nr:hypothetical protein [Nostoc sp. NMS8]MBN3959664.1 hypothetical protein [Nostoc sp. NMS8]
MSINTAGNWVETLLRDFQEINDPKHVIAFALGVPVGVASRREGYEAKQSQRLGLLRFAHNDNWAFFLRGVL